MTLSHGRHFFFSPVYTLVAAASLTNSSCICFCVLQHQQQVVQAVERAKQVTMAELNAVIGVRGLPGLPPTVCIPLLTLYLNHIMSQCFQFLFL